MNQKLKKGIGYALTGGLLLVVAALLLLAVSHAVRFYRPMRTPLLERLGFPGIALALLALAAILFAVVFRHPRRLLVVSLLGLLAFVVLNLVSGRHVLPDVLIWPSPPTLSERYVQTLAAGDLEAALQLAYPSHECHQTMTQQFLDQQAQLAERLGDGWSESGFRHSTAKRITTFYADQMPQHLVHVQVETEAGRTAWLTLRMRHKPLMGARYICGTGIPADPTTTGLSPTAGAGSTAAPSPTGLSATLEAPARLPDGSTVIVQFTLTNNSDVDLYVLKWYTPLEGIAGEIFGLTRDGQAIPYTGILAMRGDPTPEEYVLLEAGQSASAEVDLATSFDFSQPGAYTIQFLSPRISHLARSEAEMARSVDDLGPVAIPSNTVVVQIEGPSTGPAQPALSDHLVHYQGQKPLDRYAPPFEVDYSPSDWEFVESDNPSRADQLLHRHLAGCSLWLGDSGVGARQLSTLNLAGYDWTVMEVLPQNLRYYTLREDKAFTFGLMLPDTYTGNASAPCQRAAEEVLQTLRVVSQPLPHSMKGYELYSWYDENEGTWYYTLVTGTDRLKNFEEIILREKKASTQGWTSITVRGDEALKAELRRLPEGEQVTWIGAEWLKLVGADEEMAGTIELPDGAIVAELEALCRERGVVLLTTIAQAPTSRPEPAPAQTLFPEATNQDTGAPQLVIRASPIVAAGIDGPGHLEYDDRLGAEILARIKALRTWSAGRALERTNAALAPFGHRLESRFDFESNRTCYDLYRHGEAEPLRPGLCPLWPASLNASVNASGTGFALVEGNTPDARLLYLMPDGDEVQERGSGISWAQPGYVGDDLARVTHTGDVSFTYQVELGARPVYTGTAALYGAYMPLRSFTTWDDHWVLEVDDHLIMDGQDVGQALGYDAAFGFRRLGGQSFYFFEQNGLVGISYGGQVLPDLYEQVFHNRCCEAAIHNVEAGPDAVWFHALRDGVWYWVEAGTPTAEMADQAGEELALQSLVDFFERLSAGWYQEVSPLYGGSYQVLIDNNPSLDPQDHAALWSNACTINGFQCLRVRSARLVENVAAGAEYRFLVEFSTPEGELFVRGPCCGASETEMPSQSEFSFVVVRGEDGAYRVQDLPVYVP